MKALRALLVRLRRLFTPRRIERELADEIECHLALHIEDNLRLGMTPEEARRRALVKLGGLDRTFEEYRDRSAFRWISEFHRNCRHVILRLSKAPALSLAVVLSLGLGIGANTAIFSIMHQLLLRSLAVDKPEELAFVRSSEDKSGRIMTGGAGGVDFIFSYPALRDLERHSRNDVAGIAGFRNTEGHLSYRGQTQSGRILMVSGRYFPLLRTSPLIGRMILPADDRGAGNPVAVLGHKYWRTRLGARTDVLKQTIRVKGKSFTVVGVAPRGFTGTTAGDEPDIIVPLASRALLDPSWDGANRYDDYWIYLLARIRSGRGREEAAAAYAGVHASIVEKQARAAGIAPNRAELRISPLVFVDGKRGHSDLQAEVKAPLRLMMASTGLVLLIAIVNAANLLIAHSASRRRELSVHAALGASRGRIIGRLFAEALSLSLAGGIAGLAISYGALRLLASRIANVGIPSGFLPTHIDWPLLLYCAGLSLLTSVLFGLYPALRASNTAPIEALSQETGRASEGHCGLRGGLVCTQVALSIILLIPTGLLLKSLATLMNVDLGMRTENLLKFTLSPSAGGLSPEHGRALFERAEQELAAIPGVAAATSTAVPLISGSQSGNTLTVEGVDKRGHDLLAMTNQVAPGFFGRIGIPLIQGREFTERDNLAGPKVAIVDEQFAQHFFPGQNPIGRKFAPGWGPAAIPDIEIVGVAKSSNYASVAGSRTRTYYTPWRQHEHVESMTFYLRSPLPAAQTISRIRKVVHELNPHLPIEELRTMEEQVQRSIFENRILAELACISALLATVLAMIGLYGLMTHTVLRRTREIGIRMALGADRVSITTTILREMLLILAIGLGLGIPAALALSKQAESSFFGVESTDPLITVIAALALAFSACVAAYLPARRAAHIDPMKALRYE